MPTLNSANEIAIHHLYVKSALSDARELARDLETGSWPEVPGREWLFVRSLGVKARKHELRLRTSQALDAARHGAVFGGAGAAPQANAVRFDSLPELLTYLLRDIANGDASYRWYWQRWAYLLQLSKGDAIGRLLWEHATLLPEIVEPLAQLNQLEKIWRLLPPANAQIIADRLYARCSYLCQSSSSQATESQVEALPAFVRIFNRIPSLLHLWTPALNGLSATDPRIRLAATIIGISHFPLLLARYPESANWLFYQAARKMQWLGLETDSEPHGQPRLHRKAQPGPRQARPQPKIPAPTSAASTSPMKSREQPQTSPAMPVAEQVRPETEPQPRGQPGQTTRTEATDTTAPPPEQRPSEDNALQTLWSVGKESTESAQPTSETPVEIKLSGLGGNEFPTSLGGLFFLINALTPFVEALLQSPSASLQGGGFRWLFELLRRFDCEADGQLLHFLAGQCGFDNAGELLEQAPLDDFDEVFAELQKRYAEVWNSELLSIPAMVHYSRSHIDVYLPLASVRLEVRLHGLDVNPGWVPWLGRVVAIHYNDSAFEVS